MKFMRRLHKWLALAVALQLLIWIGTGIIMSWLDAREAAGSNTRIAPMAVFPLSTLSTPPLAIAELPLDFESADKISLQRLLTRPVYRVESRHNTLLLDAISGDPVIIDANLAAELARDTYEGAGQPSGSEYLPTGSEEVVDFHHPLWRVNFADEINTRVYVAAMDGHVLAHRNDTSELLDFLLMLHFMDYTQQHNFNNFLIIGFGFGTLWLALSGAILLVNSVRRIGLR